MAALKFFGKEKNNGKPGRKKTSAPKARVKEEVAVKEETGKNADNVGKKANVVSFGDSNLVRPHITEKATELAAKNQYIFVVQSVASKKEIEHSVEKAYGVHVVRVRIINVPARKVRLGRTKGMKSGYKKAIVQVKEGQSIEILPT